MYKKLGKNEDEREKENLRTSTRLLSSKELSSFWGS